MQVSQQHDRFKDAPWFPDREESLLIGGAGGIGSWVSFLLARAGFFPIVYDFDVLEAHNIGGQLYKGDDVGKFKVVALGKNISDYCGVDISIFNKRFDLNSPGHYFMISAFDNMRARKDFFEVWKRQIPNCPITPIFIDGRLVMEQLQIFCVTPDRAEEYEREYLFEDSEVEDAPCTLRQTSHSAAMIASLMVSFFTNHFTNISEREVVRDIPFFYQHFIPLNLTERE